MANTQNVTEFIFLELSPNQKVQKVCFMIFLLLYVAIVLGNFLIVLNVMSSRHVLLPQLPVLCGDLLRLDDRPQTHLRSAG